MSADGQRGYVGNGAGDGDLRATSDPDGTIFNAGGGNDVLRGGNGDDIMTGGSGDDQMYGGNGADQFRFFGNQIEGASDTDDIYDFDFSEGDKLVFSHFGADSFQDDVGVVAYDSPTGNDSAAQVTSWEGVANFVNNNAAVTASQQGNNGNLVISVTDSDGQVQRVVISGGWDDYVAAGGTEGVI